MNLNALTKLSYGLFIVSSVLDDKKNGFISNTVFQISSEPVMLGICCSKNNYTTSMIAQSKVFGVSTLHKDAPAELIGTFGYRSGRDEDKLSKVNAKRGKTGVPLVYDGTMAFYECKVINTLDLGTHIMFIGELVDCEITDNNAEPLTYAYYKEIRKGEVPVNAPTFLDPEKVAKEKEKEASGEKFKCTICGYIYKQSDGDPAGGFPAGTAFSDLPDNWTCPLCAADKTFFISI